MLGLRKEIELQCESDIKNYIQIYANKFENVNGKWTVF